MQNRTHNPEVVGSNPAPATRIIAGQKLKMLLTCFAFRGNFGVYLGEFRQKNQKLPQKNRCARRWVIGQKSVRGQNRAMVDFARARDEMFRKTPDSG